MVVAPRPPASTDARQRGSGRKRRPGVLAADPPDPSAMPHRHAKACAAADSLAMAPAGSRHEAVRQPVKAHKARRRTTIFLTLLTSHKPMSALNDFDW